MKNTQITNHNNRRFDIDHLRVYAFGLLILYHTAMLYTPNWGFHIKSTYSSDFIESLMLLANPWRMPLIWIVSGIATHFLLNKHSTSNFLMSRSIRLLLPLTFGILFIVPFQLYFEMKAKGDMSLNLWQFWQIFFELDNPTFANYQSGILPHIDVNHLWYLRALWPFTLILVVIAPILNSNLISRLITKTNSILGSYSALIVPILVLFTLDIVIFSDLEGDSQRHAEGFSFFILGYLMTGQSHLWESMKAFRRISLLLAIFCYILIIFGYNTYYLETQSLSNDYLKVIFSLIYQADRWCWLATIFGYAFTYLNKPSKLINTLNPSVYPIYILHQTFIISFAYPLIQLKLSGPVEAILVLTCTFAACWISYLMIKNIMLLRPLFGLKIEPAEPRFIPSIMLKPPYYNCLACLMVLPIAIPIFTWFFGLG